MELLFGLILGFGFGGSLMLLVGHYTTEKALKGWQETIDDFKEYHEYVIKYKEQVEKFLKELKEQVENSIEKEKCEHPNEGAFACDKCSQKRY